MKILFFSQYFWPENFRINEVASHFHKNGNKVKVLTTNPSYPNKGIFNDFYKKNKKFDYYKGIEILRIPTFARRRSDYSIILNYMTFFLSSFIGGVYKLISVKFDFIFIFGTSPILSALPGIFLKKIFKKKIILWVLDLWPNNLIELKRIKSKVIIIILKKLVKYIYDNSDLIIVQSKSFKTEIEEITNRKCIYIPSWSEDIGDDEKVLAPEIIKEENKINILFTGNIGEAQSIESVIECAKILRKEKIAKWVFVGSGRWKSKIVKLIRDNNLENEFQLIDNVPLFRIKSFFNHADVLFLSLKKNENFKKTIPGKLFTYLASGKPIIGMISGEANKLITESKSGYACEADDFQALRNNILKFKKLTSSEKLQLGINGKNFSKKYFDKSIILDNLEKLIFENFK